MADTVSTIPIVNGGSVVFQQSVTLDSSANVTPQSVPRVNGAPVATANPMPVASVALNPGYGNGASVNAPSVLIPLATGTVVNPGALYVQNQSASVLQIVLNPNAVSPLVKMIVLVSPGGGANQQGGDWQASTNMPWFVGAYEICGPSGSQFMYGSN